MRTLAIIIILCALLSVGCNNEKSNYDAGIEAYKRGHYSVALSNFESRVMKAEDDFVAQFCLGYMYDQRQIPLPENLKNSKEAEKTEWYKKNAEKWYTKSADQNYTPAMNNLAKMHYDGLFDSKGKELWKQAEEMGNRTAQFNLGFAYLVDAYPAMIDSEKLEKAEKLLKSAASQELPRAANYLGFLYKIKAQHAVDTGNFELASKWYEMQENSYKAADNMAKDEQKSAGKKEEGHAQSQYNLGEMYEKGRVAQSFTENERWKKAFDWYEQAAEQGHAGAQSKLGFMYYLGNGVDKDLKKAMELFRKAAEQGVVYAQNNLANMYSKEAKRSEDERTAKLNREMAARWLLLAAQQGEAFAQVNLAKNFEKGLNGRPQERSEAYYWYSLALRDPDYLNSDDAYIDLGETTSKVQDFATEVTEWHESVGNHLNEEERNKIQERVNNWKPKDDSYGSGTGFYIDEHYILTNAHVVTKDKDMKHKYNEFCIPYRRVELITWERQVDLALLYDERGNTDSATFRNAPVYMEEKIDSFGYPQSRKLSYEGNSTSGIVSGPTGSLYLPYPENYFQHTAPIQRGNSGGPVFDSTGNVVGVSVYMNLDRYFDRKTGQYLNIAQNINFAIRFNVIEEFLEKKDFVKTISIGVSPHSKFHRKGSSVIKRIHKSRAFSMKEDVSKKEDVSEDVSKKVKKFTVPVLSFKNKDEKTFETDYDTMDIGIHELKP